MEDNKKLKMSNLSPDEWTLLKELMLSDAIVSKPEESSYLTLFKKIESIINRKEERTKIAVECCDCGDIRIIELPYCVDEDMSGILYCDKCKGFITPNLREIIK